MSICGKWRNQSMAAFVVEVIRRGSIIVDGVDSLEDAKDYIEKCYLVDEVKWDNFLEAGYGEEVWEIQTESEKTSH